MSFEFGYLRLSCCAFLCRVNDWLLKINDVDLTNKDRKQVIKAVLSGEGVINMVVRRRKSMGGRIITPIQINLTGNKGQNSPVDNLIIQCFIFFFFFF